MPAKRPAASPRRAAANAGAVDRATALLEIDLGAVAKNWRLLAAKVGKKIETAAVVKANAYGLGAVPIAKTLARAGCKTFFVASLDEGLTLRSALKAPVIAVLNGLLPGQAGDMLAARLTPVLNDLSQLDAWRAGTQRLRNRPAAILHLDTGMSRLGLSRGETAILADEPQRVAGVELSAIISHLACAEEPKNPKNAEQRRLFLAARRRLPHVPASLANSSGIFLGPDFHFDMVRPGAAIYGVNPLPGSPNPMAQVVSLKGKIIQVRDVDRGSTVGYGAAHRMERAGRIATVAVGYADGWFRSMSARATAIIGGKPVPVVGRISMDLMTLDVTGIDPALLKPGAFAVLLNDTITVDVAGERAHTIGYEILTALGSRYRRSYIEAE